MPVLNMSHQKGGVGKSTLSYHLAYLLKKNHKVTLLDLDNQHTISEISKLRIEAVKKNTIIIKQINTKNELITFINNFPEEEFLIIDSGGFDSTNTRLAIMAADINITPVADRVTDLLAVIKAYEPILNEISNKQEEKSESFVLLNRIHISATQFSHVDSLIDESPHLELLTADNIPVLVRERSIFDKSFIEGLAIHEVKLSNNEKENKKILSAQKDIENLRDWILEKLA